MVPKFSRMNAASGASTREAGSDATENETTRPRLLFVVNVDRFFVSHRLPIAEAALTDGYDVHLACADTGLKQFLESRGIRVHELKFGRSDTSPIAAVRNITRVMLLLRALRPDVTHLVTIKPVLLGGIGARLAGAKRVVAAVSGLGYVFLAKGLLAQARRLMVGLLYRIALASKEVVVIFQNPADAQLVTALAGLVPSQIKIIRGSGVDLAWFTPEPLPDGEPVVVFAARLLIDKGVREFVEAAYVLREQGLRARFIVAGDPDLENPASLQKPELDSWCKDGVVELVGHVDDVRQLFARSHLVVLPSYREGLPKVLMEAAACGRAVITSDVPGCRDAVTPEETALLVPPRTVTPLASAMKVLIEDRERCAAMGRAGRRLAEEAFGVRGVVDAHLDIYAQLTGRQR